VCEISPVKADVFSVRHPKPDISLLTKLCTEVIMHVLMKIHIQYWCIDGKYRIYVARLRNGGKTSFISIKLSYLILITLSILA
jgi:hypothetical protein